MERDPRYTLVGGAGTGTEGIQLAKSLHPDLVVMEVCLPDQDAFQVIRTLQGFFAKTPVMILSAYRQMSYIIKALQSGATGYLLKESPCESILDGLEAVLRGDYYLDSSVSPDVFMEIHSSAWDNEKTPNSPTNKYLTPREQEIMGLLAEGVSRKQIAQRLSISPRTVENHAASIMRKLSLKSTIELVRCAAKFGLINVDEWKREPVGMAYSGSFSLQQA